MTSSDVRFGNAVRPINTTSAITIAGDDDRAFIVNTSPTTPIASAFGTTGLLDAAVTTTTGGAGITTDGQVVSGEFANPGTPVEIAGTFAQVVGFAAVESLPSFFVALGTDGKLDDLGREGTPPDTPVAAMASAQRLLAILHRVDGEQQRVSILDTDNAWAVVASVVLPPDTVGTSIAFEGKHLVVGVPGDTRCGSGAGRVLVYRLFLPGDPGAGGLTSPSLVLKHALASRDPVDNAAFGARVAVHTRNTIGGAVVAVGSGQGVDVFVTRTEDAVPQAFAAGAASDVQLLGDRLWVGMPDPANGVGGLVIVRSVP